MIPRIFPRSFRGIGALLFVATGCRSAEPVRLTPIEVKPIHLDLTVEAPPNHAPVSSPAGGAIAEALAPALRALTDCVGATYRYRVARADWPSAIGNLQALLPDRNPGAGASPLQVFDRIRSTPEEARYRWELRDRRTAATGTITLRFPRDVGEE